MRKSCIINQNETLDGGKARFINQPITNEIMT